jgi:hypothetical protein
LNYLVLFTAAFRCLDRVQFLSGLCDSYLNVGSHIAIAESPFGGGVRKTYTIFAGREILRLLAAVTLVYNRFAGSSCELAPIAVHEETFNSLLGGCTNHGYHILPVSNFRNLFFCIYMQKMSIEKTGLI